MIRFAPNAAQRGSVLPKVLLFSVGLTLVFTLVANSLPQVEGEAPRDEKVDLGALTMESFAALGESIFSGKGTCTLCHNSMGRAPDILAENVAEAAAERLADPRYAGQARDVESYLRESMVAPGQYVVKGFGKKGSNDTESPMPVVTEAPIQLSAIEIDAVIAFLQSKDGNEVTVSLPSEAPPASEADAQPPAAPAATAEQALNKFSCTACHAILQSTAPVGPALTDVGARLSAAQLRESITSPNAVVAEGFPANVMPADFASKMTVSELDLIVGFLAQQKN